jgi:hypothetical protein
VAVGAFLLGFVPEKIRAKRAVSQLDRAQGAARLLDIQTKLATAAIDARRGEYEQARKSASAFFNELLDEIDRGKASALSVQQRQRAGALLGPRDDIITLLARSDPASPDRLADLYIKYQAEMGQRAAGNSIAASP